MHSKPHLPPHLADDEELSREEAYRLAKSAKIGPQGPSKYGPGGRRLAKAKARKKS